MPGLRGPAYLESAGLKPGLDELLDQQCAGIFDELIGEAQKSVFVADLKKGVRELAARSDGLPRKIRDLSV